MGSIKFGKKYIVLTVTGLLVFAGMLTFAHETESAYISDNLDIIQKTENKKSPIKTLKEFKNLSKNQKFEYLEELGKCYPEKIKRVMQKSYDFCLELIEENYNKIKKYYDEFNYYVNSKQIRHDSKEYKSLTLALEKNVEFTYTDKELVKMYKFYLEAFEEEEAEENLEESLEKQKEFELAIQKIMLNTKML